MNHTSKMLQGGEHPRSCYTLMVESLEIYKGPLLKIQPSVSLTEELTDSVRRVSAPRRTAWGERHIYLHIVNICIYSTYLHIVRTLKATE